MKTNSKSFFYLMILLMIFTGVSVSGCTTLKRKFVRQKPTQDQKEMFIPVLEPIEYPSVSISPKKTYTTHFVMMRSYYRDLWTLLGRGDNDQRERYLFIQMIDKIKAMSHLLKSPYQEQVADFAQKAQDCLPDLDQAPSMRRYDTMKNQLRFIERDLMKNFKPSKISEDWFIDEQE